MLGQYGYQMSEAGSGRKTLWAFSALSSSLAAGYGVLFTVVGDFRDAYGISESQIGVLIGIGFLAGFVSQIFVAPFADRGYARRVVILGVGANVVGMLMMAFGTSLSPLIAGRLVSGVGIGASLPAIRRIVIAGDPENLGANMGRLLSADVFGFASGPAISAVLVGPFGLASPFLVVATAVVVCLWYAMRLRIEEVADDSGQRLAVDLLKDRVVAGAVVLGSAAFLMIGAFDALWDVVHVDLDTPDWMANLGITLFAVPLVVFGPTGGRLAERIGPFRIGAAGIVSGAIFMTLYGSVPSGTWIFSISLLHALSDGLTIAASGVAVAMVVPEHRQAGAQGMIGAGQALTAGITAIGIGWLYDDYGRAVAYTASAIGMIVFVAGALWLSAPFWRDGEARSAAAAMAQRSA